MTDAAAELRALNATISTACLILGPHRPLLLRWQEEQRHFDSIGPILDPTLWNSAERRRAAEILGPVYDQTRLFLDAVETARLETLIWGGERR